MRSPIQALTSIHTQVKARRLSETKQNFVEESLIADFKSTLIDGLQTFAERNSLLEPFVKDLVTLFSQMSRKSLTDLFFELFCATEVISKIEAAKKLPSSIEQSSIMAQLAAHSKLQRSELITKVLISLEENFIILLRRSKIPGISLSKFFLSFSSSSFADLFSNDGSNKSQGKYLSTVEEFNQLFGKLVSMLAFVLHTLFRSLSRSKVAQDEPGSDFELLALRLLFRKSLKFEKFLKIANFSSLKNLNSNPTKVTSPNLEELVDSIRSEAIFESSDLSSRFTSLVLSFHRNLTEDIPAIFRLSNFLSLFSYVMYRKTGMARVDFSWEYEIIRCLSPCLPQEVIELVICLDQIGCLKGSQRFACLKEQIRFFGQEPSDKSMFLATMLPSLVLE